MITASRYRFIWPTVDEMWAGLADTPELAPLFAWRGTWKGRVVELGVVALEIVLFVALKFVPLPHVTRLADGRRAVLVSWLVWIFYFGPRRCGGCADCTPRGVALTEEQLAELARKPDIN